MLFELTNNPAGWMVQVPVRTTLEIRVTPRELLTLILASDGINSRPLVWAALPAYSRVELEPYVGPVVTTAVPCSESTPFTVTPVLVLVPEPASVRLL